MKIRYLVSVLALLILGSCQLLDFFVPAKTDTLPPARPATSLSLRDANSESPDAVFLTLGSSATFTAQLLPTDTTDAIVWTSSAPEFVEVTQEGVVTLVAAPNTPVTITATAGSTSATFTVALRLPATTLRFLTYMFDRYVDHDMDANYTGLDTLNLQVGAQTLPAETTDEIVWTSSDPTQVTITDPVSSVTDNGDQTVTMTKFIKVLQHLTSDVVITATAGSLTKTLTLTPAPTVALKESINGNPYSDIPAFSSASSDIDGYAYLQVEFSPASATVTWSCTDTAVIFSNQTTVTVSGRQYSRVTVNSLSSSGTPTITARVTTVSGDFVDATCTIQQSSQS